MKKRLNSRFTGLTFLIPSFLGICLFYLVPFAISFAGTFTTGTAQDEFVFLDNFIGLFHNPAFLLATKNTALFLVIGVPILLILSLFISLQFTNAEFRILKWVLLIPFALPSPAFAAAGQKVLSLLGFTDGGTLHPVAPFVMAIILFVLKNVGYTTILFHGTLSGFSREYREVFLLESTSFLRYGISIVIPLLFPMIFFALILAISHSFQIFRELYLIYGNSPPSSVYMLQNFMTNNFQKLNIQRLSAASFMTTAVLSLIVLGYLWVQQRIDGGGDER